jgi:hypothetical protein
MQELRQPVSLARTEKDFKAGGGTVAHVPVLPSSLNLLVFVKGSPLQIAAQLKLRQLPFVRQMTINENDPHYRTTYQLNAWVAATEFGYTDLGTRPIELRFKPVKGEDEMVLAVPVSVLAPGLFVLDDFIFAVPPIETAALSECIDAARPVGGFAAWRTWPCSGAPVVEQPPSSRAQPSTMSRADQPDAGAAAGSIETALGFIVLENDVPVFKDAGGTEIKAHLPSGAAAANAKGSLLGLPTEFALEEANGRTHIIYLQDRKTRWGWVESRQLNRFEYDCSCKPRCNPTDYSLRQGTSWTDCFERARDSETPRPPN